MLKLNTNLFGDEVPAGMNGTPSPLVPPPVKSLPGQASLFSAGNFFDDDAEPMPVKPLGDLVSVSTTPSGEVTAAVFESEPAKPFVDDTPPFDVPAEVVKAGDEVEPGVIAIPAPPTTDPPLLIELDGHRSWTGEIKFSHDATAEEINGSLYDIKVPPKEDGYSRKLQFESIGVCDEFGNPVGVTVKYRIADTKNSPITAPELPPIVSESLPAPVAVEPETVCINGNIVAEPVEVSFAEAEHLYSEKLQSLETELADLDLDVLSAKDELKRVSKLQQSAAKILRSFKYRGVEGFHDDLIEERQAEADEAAEQAAINTEDETPKPSRAATSKDTAEEKPPFNSMASGLDDDDFWQNVSVRELKINPKTITRLIESGIDTLEKLEWRRKGVHDGAEKWPTGIGEKKVTEIEDGIVKWFSEHQTDKAATELPADPVAVENDTAEPAAKKTRKSRKKKAEAEIYDEDEEAEQDVGSIHAELTKEDHEAEILEEVEAIKARGEANYSEPPADAELCRKWDTGYEYCQSGGPVTDCILEGGSQRTSWLKGWLTADAAMKAK